MRLERKKEQGFMMIGLLIVLSILMILSVHFFQLKEYKKQEDIATIIGHNVAVYMAGIVQSIAEDTDQKLAGRKYSDLSFLKKQRLPK